MSKDSLASPKRCTNCKDYIDTAPGMDSAVEIADYDTTEIDTYYFCDWQCVGEWFDYGTDMGLIPYNSEKDPQYVEPETDGGQTDE